MAIDFPNSPTLNQEFTAGGRVWFWNGTAWKSKESQVIDTGKYTVSETAPANPEIGDGWFDSVNTREFIYYDGFWVETSAAAVGLPAANYATEEYVDAAVDAIPEVDLTGYATETYVGNQIANLVDSAPSTLDTLNELAAALADDPSFATTITNELANKASTVHTHAISDVTNLQTNLDAKSTKVKNIVSLTTSRAITDTDSDSLLVSSSESNINLTIPLDQANDLANGFKLEVSKIGNGNVAVFPGSGTQPWTSFTGAAYGVYGIESNTSGSTTIVVTGSSATKTIYRTVNAGTTWTSIGTITASTTLVNNRRVAYSSGKFIIAANGSAYISDNDGVTFTQYSSGLTASDVFVAGAISTDGNTILLIKETPTNNVAISTDAGTSFSYSTITLPTNHVPGDILYSSTSGAFYLLTKGGSISINSINLYKSLDGVSWTLLGSGGQSSSSQRTLMAEKNGILFMRIGSKIYSSTNGQTLVEKANIGSTSISLKAAYWLGSTFYVREGAVVHLSADNGETWTAASSFPSSSNGSFSSSSETLIMAGTTTSSTYYKTGSITVSLNGGYSAISLETAEESIGLVKVGDDSWVTSTIPAKSTSFASTVEDHNLLALIGAI